MTTSRLLLASVFVATSAFAAPPPADKALLEKGKATFTTTCVPCHGEKGAGDGAAASALNPKPRNFVTESFKQGDKVEDVFKTLAEGVKGTAMVAYAFLPETDRWALAYHVLELRKAGKPAAAAPAAAAPAAAAPAPAKAAPAKKK